MKKIEIIKEIKSMVKMYPNDLDLGNQVRAFLLNLKSKKSNGI